MNILFAVVGFIISLCSCALSCDHLKMDLPMPDVGAGMWVFLVYYIKSYIGGIALWTVQASFKIIYLASRNIIYDVIFWAATVFSISISFCSFYSVSETCVIDVERDKTEYNALIKEREMLMEKIATTERGRADAMAVYVEAKLVSKGTNTLNKTVVAELDRDKARLKAVKSEIAAFLEDDEKKKAISSQAIYKAIANDVGEFFCLPNWVVKRISTLIRWSMVGIPASLVDLGGNYLLMAGLLGLGVISMIRYQREQLIEDYDTAYCTDRPIGAHRYSSPAPESSPHYANSDYGGHGTDSFSENKASVNAGANCYSGEQENVNDYEPVNPPHTEPINDYSTYDPPHITPVEMSDTESRLVEAYQENGSYNGALRSMGIAKGPETLQALKDTLDKFDIPHGRGNGKGAAS